MGWMPYWGWGTQEILTPGRESPRSHTAEILNLTTYHIDPSSRLACEGEGVPGQGQPKAFRFPADSQRAQHSLMKEYTLNYVLIPYMIWGIFLNSAVLGSLGSSFLGTSGSSFNPADDG